MVGVSACASAPTKVATPASAAAPSGSRALQGTAAPVFPGITLDTAGSRPSPGGPTYVPLWKNAEKFYGTGEGGTRGIVGGVRTLTQADGSVRAARDRFAQMPTNVVALSEHLGGGFLFLVGNTIHRADTWLADARPIVTAGTSVFSVYETLDRVVLQGSTGGPRAFDPRTGAPLSLGPWPPAPSVAGYAAFDPWTAVALTDGRGLLITKDAGATWENIPVPFNPTTLFRTGNRAIVTGTERERNAAVSFEVTRQGELAKVPSVVLASRDGSTPAPDANPRAHALGFHDPPLVVAMEDGWPLADGTAIVARDGALSRIELATGRVVERVAEAFPQASARCHAFPLGPDKKGLGFACGERGNGAGSTVVYRYQSGKMLPLASFDTPRVVLPSGSGTFAVRGGCARGAPAPHRYCVYADKGLRDIDVQGEVDHERLIALGDGRVAIVSPPHGKLQDARVTVLAQGGMKTLALAFPRLRSDTFRVLEQGLWLEGFEERRPGVLGGWVEHRGVVLGIEIALTGQVTLGDILNDAGSFALGGRYGFRWAGSRRGFETTDGGIKWTQVELPDPVPGRETSRVCGPLGCMGQGWLRLGWGDATKENVVLPPPPRIGMTSSPAIHLHCSAVGDNKKTEDASEGAPAFFSVPAPKVRSDERAVWFDIYDGGDRYSRTAPVGRVYGWGPKSSEWDLGASGVTRWLSPFEDSAQARSTKVGAIPKTLRDIVRPRTSGGSMAGNGGNFFLGFGDDKDHALLALRTYQNGRAETLLFALETNRPPVELRRLDGEPFTDFESATRMNGQWFGSFGTPAESTLFAFEGASARVVARFPRVAGPGIGRTTPRLARSDDERRLGYVLDGQSASGATAPDRWIFPVLVESGRILDPENFGPTDLSGIKGITACGDTRPSGYVVDAPISATVDFAGSGGRAGSMYNTQARLHLGRDAACVERLTGTLDTQAIAALGDHSLAAKNPPPKGAGTLPVVGTAHGERRAMRCAMESPTAP